MAEQTTKDPKVTKIKLTSARGGQRYKTEKDGSKRYLGDFAQQIGEELEVGKDVSEAEAQRMIETGLAVHA